MPVIWNDFQLHFKLEYLEWGAAHPFQIFQSNINIPELSSSAQCWEVRRGKIPRVGILKGGESAIQPFFDKLSNFR